MTIFLVLALGMLICFASNKHKFILFYAPFSVMLQPWMCIRYSPPALSLSFSINFVLTIFLLLKRKRSIKKNPFYYVIILMLLGNLIGMFSSVHDISSSFTSFVQSVCFYAPLLLFYDEIRTEKDLKLTLKAFVCVAIVLLVYGLVEFILQKNPLFLYVLTQVSKEELLGKLYFNELGAIRFGSIRCQSLMTISITWGALCVIFFGVFVSIKKYLNFYYDRYIFYLIVMLSLVGTFSAGSRTPYIFLMIIIIPLFIKKFSTMEKILFVIVISITLFLSASTIGSIAESFSSKSDISGSSIEMRIDQFETIFAAMNDKFIFGMGNKGLGYILKRYPNVYGAESIWFQIFISTGICGVILLILQYYLTFRIIMKNSGERKIEMCFLLLGWIFFSTMTTSPGLSYVYFLTMIAIIMKCDAIKKCNMKG